MCPVLVLAVTNHSALTILDAIITKSDVGGFCGTYISRYLCCSAAFHFNLNGALERFFFRQEFRINSCIRNPVINIYFCHMRYQTI